MLFDKGFKVPRGIPENFISFLIISHPRLGFYSYGKDLPYGLFRHIFSFIKGLFNLRLLLIIKRTSKVLASRSWVGIWNLCQDQTLFKLFFGERTDIFNWC